MFKFYTLFLFSFSILFAQPVWQLVQNLSNTSFATSDYQTMISQGSNFYLAWADNGEIKYKFSSNSGVSWTSNILLPAPAGTNGWPSIAASGSNVYVAYHDLNNVFINRSTDNGFTWGSTVTISGGTATAITPQVAASGDSIWASWEERIGTSSNYEIVFRRSYDGGATWTPIANLTNNPTHSRWVQLERYEGVLYLAWLESPQYPQSDIYFSKSSDGGTSWTAPANLTNDALPQQRIDMKILESTIYIVSQDQFAINLDEIGFMKSTDLGQTWSTPVNVSNNAGNSSFPNIFPLRNPDGTHRLYLAWPDNTNTPGNLEIFFVLSNDNGAAWTSPVNLSNNSENSYRPHIAVSTNGAVDSIGIAWYDFSPGAADILFRRGVNTDIVPVELLSFSALVNGSSVHLNWRTASETNNSGFEIQRSDVRGQRSEWMNIGFVEGYGTTTEPQQYSFTDNLELEHELELIKYRLKQIDFDGSFEYSKEIEVDVNNLPIRFALYQNYPNPFNPLTKIKYSVPSSLSSQERAGVRSFVTLKVFDILGNQVATLVNEVKQPGVYEAEWNASKNSSGVYYYKLSASGVSGNFSEVKKMILMK